MKRIPLRVLGSGLILAAGLLSVLPALTPPAQARQNRGGRGGNSGRVRVEYSLIPAAGVAGLKGHARVEARGAREKVKVEVESRTLPAGTEFDVYFLTAANGPDGEFLGTVILGQGSDDALRDSAGKAAKAGPKLTPLRRGRGGDDNGDRDDDDDRGGRGRGADDAFGIQGELELKNWDGNTLPANASPVTAITGFLVRNAASQQLVLTSRRGR